MDNREYIESRSVPEPNSGCWLWELALTDSGYGLATIGKKPNRKRVPAHRLSYSTFKGPIPSGYCVCHTCDCRSCVNPGHLFLGTIADNVADMDAKGRRYVLRGAEHHAARLTENDVKIIRELLALGWTGRIISYRFGVSERHISDIKHRNTWSHL